MIFFKIGEKMISSKERALPTFNHYSVDRVPLDLGGWVTTIHKKAYDNLIQFSGIPEVEKEVHDWIRQTVIFIIFLKICSLKSQ